MRFLNKYLKLQFKRAARAYVIVLAFTLVLLAILGTVGATMLQKRQNDESFKKVKVGVVGDKEDKILSMGISMLQTMDSSGFSVELSTFDDEDKAISAMKTRGIDAYITVPKNFARLLWRGEDVSLTYVMAKSGASMSTLLTRDILNVVSNYIVESQRAIIAICDYAEYSGYTEDEVYSLDYEVSIKYIDLIVARDNLTDVKEVGLGGTLSFVGYYICGFTVFFILCLGLTCCTLRVKGSNTLDCLLYSKGCGATGQIVAEYIPYFLISFITLAVMLVAAGLASKHIEFGVAELEYLILTDYISMAFKLIPIVLVITAFQFLLYELVSGLINAVLLQFTAVIVLGYISGCFYPIYFLPNAVQRVASVLPIGISIDYFGAVLTDKITLTKFLICLLYAMILLVIGVIVRRIKIIKSEGR